MANVIKNVMTTETVNVMMNVIVNVTATATPVDSEPELESITIAIQSNHMPAHTITVIFGLYVYKWNFCVSIQDI